MGGRCTYILKGVDCWHFPASTPRIGGVDEASSGSRRLAWRSAAGRGADLRRQLQDPATGRVHRFTPAARLVLAAMDGRRSVDDLWHLAQRQLGEDAPTQDDLIQLLGQLHGSDLLATNVSPDALELFDRGAKAERSKNRRSWMNPMAVRIALWDPGTFLDRFVPLWQRLRTNWFRRRVGNPTRFWRLISTALLIGSSSTMTLTRMAWISAAGHRRRSRSLSGLRLVEAPCRPGVGFRCGREADSAAARHLIDLRSSLGSLPGYVLTVGRLLWLWLPHRW